MRLGFDSRAAVGMIEQPLDALWTTQSYAIVAQFEAGEPVASRNQTPAVVTMQRQSIRAGGIEILLGVSIHRAVR